MLLDQPGTAGMMKATAIWIGALALGAGATVLGAGLAFSSLVNALPAPAAPPPGRLAAFKPAAPLPETAPAMTALAAPVRKPNAAPPAPVAAPQPERVLPVAAPAPARPEFVVGSNGLNVRAAPSSGSAKIAVLRQGEAVEVVGTRRGWAQVARGGSVLGWAYGDYLVPAATAR